MRKFLVVKDNKITRIVVAMSERKVQAIEGERVLLAIEGEKYMIGDRAPDVGFIKNIFNKLTGRK